MLAVLTLIAGPGYATSLTVSLIPCGPVPGEVLAYLEEGLRREFGAEVRREKPVTVPASAYAPKRRQYLANAFPELVAPVGPGRRHLALVITDVDLYVPTLNFVFGLADLRRGAAVVSLARLDPRFYGQASNPKRLHERALKEAVHELGHLLGLGHCANPACIMFFSNTLADTDRKGPGFCPACRRQLEALLK